MPRSIQDRSQADDRRRPGAHIASVSRAPDQIVEVEQRVVEIRGLLDLDRDLGIVAGNVAGHNDAVGTDFVLGALGEHPNGDRAQADIPAD